MADPPSDAAGQQVGQGSVDRGVGLSENERQFRPVDEGRPAEGVRLRASSSCRSERAIVRA